MVHCGYEPTAVSDTVARPLRALSVWLRGVRTEGPMAPEIDLTNARSPDYVFESNLSDFIGKGEPGSEGRENAA